MKRKAFFLDRDGTLNVEVHYLHRACDTKLIPGAAEAVKAIHDAGYLAVIITNQAGVAKGYYGEEAIFEVQEELQRQLLQASGHTVDALYYCPHGNEDNCSCRKPKPGMFLRAAGEMNIDLSQSYMIGDRPLDAAAGIAAGVKTAVMVTTGHGKEMLDAGAKVPEGALLAPDILTAVNMLLGKD